jgi:hypothetical protein
MHLHTPFAACEGRQQPHSPHALALQFPIRVMVPAFASLRMKIIKFVSYSTASSRQPASVPVSARQTSLRIILMMCNKGDGCGVVV